MQAILAHRATEQNAFTVHLDAFSPSARLWRPAPDQWSAADVMEHLLRVDKGLLRGLSQQIASGDTRSDVGTPSPEALAQLSAFMRSDQKTRVPTQAARFLMPQGGDYDTLRAEWDALPGLWRETLDRVPAELFDIGLVSHPVAGALTANGCAQFSADHIAHHAHQLQRLRVAPSFPGA